MMLSSVERVLELNIWMMSHIYKRVEYSLYNALTTILLRKRFFSGVFLNSYVGSSRAIVNEKTKKPHKIDFMYMSIQEMSHLLLLIYSIDFLRPCDFLRPFYVLMASRKNLWVCEYINQLNSEADYW